MKMEIFLGYETSLPDNFHETAKRDKQPKHKKSKA